VHLAVEGDQADAPSKQDSQGPSIRVSVFGFHKPIRASCARAAGSLNKELNARGAARPGWQAWGLERVVREGQDAARAKGVQLTILKATTEGEIDAAFATLGQSRGGAVIVGPDAFFLSRREQLVGLASRHAVPAIHPLRESAAAGGLISYGASLTATFRLLGNYAGKILNGTKPADLPIEQPTTLELVVNLKTAKALDLTVPQSILARADEVIE
jgi:putative ABC transport system substrate-binding protein